MSLDYNQGRLLFMVIQHKIGGLININQFIKKIILKVNETLIISYIIKFILASCCNLLGSDSTYISYKSYISLFFPILPIFFRKNRKMFKKNQSVQLIQYKFTLQIIVKPLRKVVFYAESEYDSDFFQYLYFSQR